VARRSRRARLTSTASSGAEETLIDAHNLIYAHPRLRTQMRDPEAARTALAQLLSGQKHVRLVCDGGPGGQASLAERHGITIEYSGSREADALIRLPYRSCSAAGQGHAPAARRPALSP